MADTWLRESGSIASNRQSPPEGAPGWKEEVSRVMIRSIRGSYQRYSSEGPNENSSRSGEEKRREAIPPPLKLQ